MKRHFLILAILILSSCKQQSRKEEFTAQQIVDKSILSSGGLNYLNHGVSYIFRDREYRSENKLGKKILKRITNTDSMTIVDIKSGSGFQRYYDSTLIEIPDSMANKYANSINSVHYFSRLPFGLNDGAVKKELLGEVSIKNEEYYKIKVTFEQNNGGEDFEDIYLYWFDKQEFKPKFLAYKFYTDGGGVRFREAYNERYVDGIRFVDYLNLKPKDGLKTDFMKIDSLYEANGLQLLSKIELKEIRVTPEG